MVLAVSKRQYPDHPARTVYLPGGGVSGVNVLTVTTFYQAGRVCVEKLDIFLLLYYNIVYHDIAREALKCLSADSVN